MQQAARVSDYTGVFMMRPDRAGELVEFGPTRQIFTNPAGRAHRSLYHRPHRLAPAERSSTAWPAKPSNAACAKCRTRCWRWAAWWTKAIDALDPGAADPRSGAWPAQVITTTTSRSTSSASDIEEQCLLLIATQAPMASDLRRLAAALNIITDLERMADHAAGNAQDHAS